MARSTKQAVAVAAMTQTVQANDTTNPEASAPAREPIGNVDVSACGNNKSAKIRLYASMGYSRSEIAKHLDIKYQFVRNVLVTPPPKGASVQPEAEAIEA